LCFATSSWWLVAGGILVAVMSDGDDALRPGNCNWGGWELGVGTSGVGVLVELVLVWVWVWVMWLGV
jgi:hypothetical protein